MTTSAARSPIAQPDLAECTNDAPRIYVACLAAYNNGKLHGAWIDADQGPDDILAEVGVMLAASPDGQAEEWAIHDYEGFGAVCVSEWEGFERVSAMAQFIVEHAELGACVLAHFNGDLKCAREAVEENYAGVYRSLADFAEDITCETAPPPEHLAHYVDWRALAHDMEVNGDVFTIETGYEEVHVFWGR